MSHIDFKEQHSYRLDELSARLECDLHKARNILKRLILAGVAKPAKAEKQSNWRDNALHEEFLSDDIGQDTRFTFTYVGVIEIEGYAIKCYPKFIKKESPDPRDLRPILLAVERYNADLNTGLSTATDEASSRMPNKLAFAMKLVRDYFIYGLYTNQRDELTLQGQGEIDWENTINTTMPVIKNSRPYYFEYYTNDTRLDDEDYITRLHACIITECSNHLKTSELDKIFCLETPAPYQGGRSDFGTDDYICQRLRKELNVQFVSQKQKILRNLLDWVENTSLATDASEIKLFGTSSFHTLWEVMCADVFESQYHDRLDSLGITLHEDFNVNDTLADLIAKPKWQATTGGPPHEADMTLRPDFIRIVTHNGQRYFVILDAKYYDVVLDEARVVGQPGVEDVSKHIGLALFAVGGEHIDAVA